MAITSENNRKFEMRRHQFVTSSHNLRLSDSYRENDKRTYYTTDTTQELSHILGAGQWVSGFLNFSALSSSHMPLCSHFYLLRALQTKHGSACCSKLSFTSFKPCSTLTRSSPDLELVSSDNLLFFSPA